MVCFILLALILFAFGSFYDMHVGYTLPYTCDCLIGRRLENYSNGIIFSL